MTSYRKELSQINDKLTKARELLLKGDLDASDYRVKKTIGMKSEYNRR